MRSNRQRGPISSYLNYTRAHYEYYADLLNRYPDYQLCLIDEDTGYPVAVRPVRAVCLSATPTSLPPEGWDWVVETAAGSPRDSVNMLGALAISVPAVQRLKGYGRLLIRALVDLAKAKGLRGVVAPVRPSAKVKHPWVPISEYLVGPTSKGRLYDPWLRSHLSEGGRLVGPCERSMVVNEPIAFWENWSNQRFESSGAYALGGSSGAGEDRSRSSDRALRRAECLGGLRSLIAAASAGAVSQAEVDRRRREVGR